MDYTSLEKDTLKEIISENASLKEFELPTNWYNMGVEKLAKLAEEIDEFQPEDPEEENKPKVGEVKFGKTGLAHVRAKLLREETILVEVPEDELDNTTHVNIWVNGQEFIYARGQMYNMPKSVAEAYNWSKTETSKAKKKMREFTKIE